MNTLFFIPSLPEFAALTGNEVAILAIPFGSHDVGSNAGASNQAIARIASELSQKRATPIIGQWELADTSANPRMLHIIGTPGEIHITTKRFVTEAIEKLPKRGRVVVVAHPDHAHRCQMILAKQGIDSVVPPECLDIPYDPESKQVWCQTKWRLPLGRPSTWGFWWFEIASRIHHKIMGWI